MKNYKIKFLPFNLEVEVSQDTDILRAAARARINIYNHCGGKGLCGKCKIRVIKGNFKVEKDFHFRDSEKKQNYVLACQTYPLSDLIVEVSPEAKVTEAQILKGRFSEVQEDLEEATSLTDAIYPLEPLIKKIRLEIPPPKDDENLPDYERVLKILAEKIQRQEPEMPLKFLRTLPLNLRAWDWRLILSYSSDIDKVVNLEPENIRVKNLGLACDIGTTTIVIYLVDLNSGKTISAKADYNRQLTYGEDVISRIIVAEEPQGLTDLNQAVIETINALIQSLASENNLAPEEINALVLAGNSTMLHLALKIPPTYLRRTPFTPGFKSPFFFRAEELGIRINPEAVVAIMPGIASFVGSDIISGILASGMDMEEAPSVFIDLGTNGEVVLGNKDWMLSCSTSAGPCFEGGVLTSGVRAMKGAIQGFEIKGEEVVFKTISDSKPLGICGSGIIEIIAEFFLKKIIDKSGNFILQSSKYLRKNKYGEIEFLIAKGEETETGQDIVVTQSDIKNLIYSKAAIYMGIEVLLRQVGLRQDEIERFYIAGGLGSYLNVEKAITIGLLPDLAHQKFMFLGNASIQGSRLYLISRKAREKALRLSQAITNIELSNSPEFMNNYSSALFLPHTDLEKFPNVKKMLAR